MIGRHPMIMRAVAQISGGLDSAVAALEARRIGYSPCGVFIDYGQPYAEPERRAAEYVARALAMPLRIIEIPRLPGFEFFPQWVPMRNAVLLSLTVARAVDEKAVAVIVGNKTETVKPCDPYSFGDSSDAFFNAMDAVIDLSLGPGVAAPLILRPVRGWSKARVVRAAAQAFFDFNKLWSCYGSSSTPCGECRACQERAEAMATLNSKGGD